MKKLGFLGKIFQTQQWLTQPEQQKNDPTRNLGQILAPRVFHERRFPKCGFTKHNFPIFIIMVGPAQAKVRRLAIIIYCNYQYIITFNFSEI